MQYKERCNIKREMQYKERDAMKQKMKVHNKAQKKPELHHWKSGQNERRSGASWS